MSPLTRGGASGFSSLFRSVVLVGGNCAAFAASAALLPLSDAAALRVTAGYFGQDGYVTRTFDGKQLGNSNRFAGRAALRKIVSP